MIHSCFIPTSPLNFNVNLFFPLPMHRKPVFIPSFPDILAFRPRFGDKRVSERD